MEHVTHMDREQTKKVVYSVIYGAGEPQGRAGFLVICLYLSVPSFREIIL